MRVLFLLPLFFDHPAGGYKVVYEYANRLAARGHAIKISYLDVDRGPLVGRLVRRLRSAGHARPKLTWFKLDPAIELSIVSRPTSDEFAWGDTIVVTSWETAERFAAIQLEGPPAVYLVQGFETWTGGAERVKATWRLPFRIVVVSSWLERLVKSEGASDVHRIPNGVDAAYRIEGSSAGRREARVGMMWDPSPVKGGDTGLEALRLLRASRPGMVPVVYSAFARPRSMSREAEFHRQPNRAALAALYRSLAVFVLPSRSEGWGLPATEAMASGAALVATDIPGIADFAVHGETALLCAVDDPSAMADAARELIDNERLRMDLVERGMRAVSGFDWDRSALRFEEALVELTR